jgi:hypothetical protein
MRRLGGAVLACMLGLLAVPVAGTQQIAVAQQTTATQQVSPPTTIPADCSADVSHPMQHWLRSLPSGTTVGVAPGACYLVDEGLTLPGAQDLTISGGTWKDASSPAPGASANAMNAVFWLIGGTDLTLQNLTIAGASPGGYDPAGAFAAGIRSDGVIGLTIANVAVEGVYGDGIELAPLRASGDMSNVIVNPSEDVSITNVSINGAGRQGVTLASVNGATINSISLKHVGINVFDVESDQWGEGALNVTIDGCTDAGGNGGLFFANAGMSAGSYYTGNITVENCTMNMPDAGDAVLVQSPQLEPHPRGLITFVDDAFQCGTSVYVACVMATDARVAVTSSRLAMPSGTVHESVYRASQESGLTFEADTVSGYGQLGSADATSSVNITGGSWTPYAAVRTPSPSSPAAAAVESAGTNASTPAPASTTPLPPSTTASTAPSGVSLPAMSEGGAATSASALAHNAPAAERAAVTGNSDDKPGPPWRPTLLGVSLAALLGLLIVRRRRRPAATGPTVSPVSPSVDRLLGVVAREEPPVGVEGPVDHQTVVELEFGTDARGPSHVPASHRIPGQSPDRLRQRHRVAHWNDQTGLSVVDDLPAAADVRGDDRQAARGRLHRRTRESLSV